MPGSFQEAKKNSYSTNAASNQSFDSAFFTVRESGEPRPLGREIYEAALCFPSPLQLLAEVAE